MNYHIFPQDKFFGTYIEDIYKLRQEDNNVFWVRGNKGDSDILKTQRPITFIGDNRSGIIEKLQSLTSQDKLIISWYDLFIGECIIDSGISSKVYVYLMGGDFYNDPIGYHDSWLYDSNTKKIVNRFHQPRINIFRRPKNWYKTIIETWQRITYRKHLKSEYKRKQETIARIDYMITGDHNYDEVKLVKHLYPDFRAQYITGSFDLNFEISKVQQDASSYDGSRPLRIMLGNSADPTNNHVDACMFLKKTILSDIEIYCPLSYGNQKYASEFQQWANDHLKTIFHPILEFLDRERYIKLLNSMDIVVMYHNRQQAFGSIVTSLCLGKPVFIKKESPLYSMLSKMEVPNVYSTNKLRNCDIQQLCSIAQKNRDLCLSIIQKYYSENARLSNLKKIIS